jgi:signal transduction histidine kinase
VKAVKELVGKNSILDHIRIIIREEDDFPRLPVKEEFALFRIIQEFLNNTLKHSRATTVRIDFSKDRDKILIHLSDNGIGFDPARLKKYGMGLNNVTSRLRPYHGDVNIISRPGKGTRYEIALPFHSKK